MDSSRGLYLMSHKPKISSIDIKAFAIAKKRKKKKEEKERKGDIITSAITRQVLSQLLLYDNKWH